MEKDSANDVATEETPQTVLVIGRRARIDLTQIVDNPDLRARVAGGRGAWSILGESVCFMTPNVNREVVEVMARKAGQSVVSFHSIDSRITERPSVRIAVVRDEPVSEEGQAEEAEEQERQRVAAEAQAEAERQQAEEAARLKAEEEAEAARRLAEEEEAKRDEAERLRLEEEARLRPNTE